MLRKSELLVGMVELNGVDGTLNSTVTLKEGNIQLS